MGEHSRWQSKTWRSPSSPQKYICMWNDSYRTPNAGRRPPTFKMQANLHIKGQGRRNKKKRDKGIGT